MTTFSTLILCAVVGQAGGNANFGSAVPVPQSSARRSLDSQAIPSSRFGAPTPAQPSVAESAPLGATRSVLTAPQASDLNFEGAPNSFSPNISANPQGNANQFNVAPTSNTTPQNGFQTASQATVQNIPENTAAMRLVRQAFPTPDDAGDENTKLSLQDVVAVSNDRTRRIAAITTYWEAATLLADWQFASEEYELIRQLSTASEQVTLAAAQTAAQARLIEAQMAANSARFALGELLPASRNDSKPLLPIDTPLVGEYNTQFETLFAARVAPPGLRRIHETLPLRHDLVEARAAAVLAAVDALEHQVGLFQTGRTSLSEVLRSLENMRTQRGAFLGALRDYNLDIAEYALGTSHPNDTPDKVVAMMIKAPNGATNLTNPVLSNTAIPSTVPSRSVLIAPAGASAPSSFSPGLPPSQLAPADGPATQLPPPQAQPTSRGAIFLPSGASPTIAAPPNANSVLTNPRVADQSGAAAAEFERPTTERVLGTLRDVTNQSPTTILQPTNGNGANAGLPALPPTSSRFGGTQFQTNPSEVSPPPTSRFGGSQFGTGQPSDNQPTGATINNSTIITPADNTPLLPPLTP